MSVPDIIKKKDYEKIIFVLRRHPITFIPIMFLFIVLMLVPVAVYLLIENLFPSILTGSILYPLTVLLGSVYYLSIYLFFYVQFIDFYLDMWIVTNDRIVDIEQHNLFHRVITELDLYRIQDVTAQVQGIFSTLFKYGDVTVKTASTTSNIIFRNVSNPNLIREQLIKLADEDRKFHYSQEQSGG
ncbi:PH domain-containing protein [Candidatus Parcubacteria bacterium]|jgi:membrane protein YdbS with pleckstrin-like domain|nr:PH domain-containing protein [Candidatus Parcubacteria bacterium]MBT3948830.1 PH domain-containing protein [Candidatus Parcubacteria bacterium]